MPAIDNPFTMVSEGGNDDRESPTLYLTPQHAAMQPAVMVRIRACKCFESMLFYLQIQPWRVACLQIPDCLLTSYGKAADEIASRDLQF
jgi:hypothetical protein